MGSKRSLNSFCFFPALLPGWCLGRELLSLQGTLCWEQPGLEPSGLGALCLNSSPIDLSVVPFCSVGCFLVPGGALGIFFAGSALAERRGCVSEVAASVQGQHRTSFRDRRVSCGFGTGVAAPCCVLTPLLSAACPFPAETRTQVADLPDNFSFPLPPQTRPQLSRSTPRTLSH